MELTELKGVCRLCLGQGKHLEPLFECPALVEKLRVLTQLQFVATEGWPAVVCWTCVDILNTFDRFKLKCIESHQQLEAFFSPPDAGDIVIKEEPLDYLEAPAACGADSAPNTKASPPLETTTNHAFNMEAPPLLKTTTVLKTEPPDFVCDPPLFVDVDPIKEEDGKGCGGVPMETGESSKSGEERFYCRITDDVFQEAIAVDVKRRRKGKAVGKERLLDSDTNVSSETELYERKPLPPPSKEEMGTFLEEVWKVCPDAAIFQVLPQYCQRLAQQMREDGEKK